MRNTKLCLKTIALFMSLVVTFVAMPVQAITLGINELDQIEDDVAQIPNDTEQDVFIVEEDLSKRGQFEKHYLCSDGTYVSVTYPEAIHYLDDNNQWQDVDQSLTYNSVTGTYISDKADFEVSFSSKASSTNIAKIERNGYTLSWGIQTTQKNLGELTMSNFEEFDTLTAEETELVLVPSDTASAKITKSSVKQVESASERSISNKDTFALPKTSSQISYSNIFEGAQNISLKYTVYHNKIEEDIIISERGSLKSVSMNMDVGTLAPIVNADGSVDLVDKDGVMQFHIGIPYMVDANHSVCNDIQVTAVKNGRICIITYTPNGEWFDSQNRVFPILLDPSITTSDYVSNIQDTYVEQNSSVNHSSEQYLYFTPNAETGNRRNSVIRVTKLPEIDPALPIISATLTLTASSASPSDVSLMAGYLDSGLEWDEYNYSVTSYDYYTYSAYSNLSAGATQVVFDFSAHIYEMYRDLAYDQENEYEYHGDFVVKYANNTDTTASNPFYSSEYTNVVNRPVFTVKYGYSLPAGMLNGNVYSFINGGSYFFMSVNGVSPANRSNVYQVWNEDEIAATPQRFKLEYVSSTGGYLIRATTSATNTNKVVGVNRGENDLTTDMNVYLSTAGDSIGQEWLIIPIDYDVFRIVPRANMSLALTAYGRNNGTNAGKTSTSEGNIFVKTLGENDFFQEWYIYDSNNNEVVTSQHRSSIKTGNYFITNKFSGKYLHRSNTNVDGVRGTISSLGEEAVKWRIVNLGDGYCTIQRSDIPGYYLAPTGTSSGSYVRLYSSASEIIPDNYKWSIRQTSDGGSVIQHKASGLYLTGVTTTTNTSPISIYALSTPGTDAYSKQLWRSAHEDYYVELGAAATFSDRNINIGETIVALIQKIPNNATWASYTDFDYIVIMGGEYVCYDIHTHTFRGVKPGTATVLATHQTTGLSDTITITVSVLKLFETLARPGLDKYGKLARDMNVSDLSIAELANININLVDLAYRYNLPPASSTLLPPQGPEALIRFMKQLPDLFAAGNADMKTVVGKMVDLFIAGTGDDFSDPILTAAVQNHPSTITFVNDTILLLCLAIESCEGDIASLSSNTSFQQDMEGNLSKLAYNTAADYTNGLKIALNGIWGYDMEIIEYECDGVNYSGKIRYTIFDHFGLDTGDITESSNTSEFLGYTDQFGSWFVLQRYVNCNHQYKPFVTYIVFEQTFSGRIS